ncbi:MAG: ABC transporter permease subunit [Acidobacteriota bacterium]|jgi:osmoprotectant transport system permease protein|nr:ABC transporter permease subunit [Acidobacteriota bacterium]
MEYILSHPFEILKMTGEHLLLVGVSTAIATLVGIPLGVFLTRRPAWSRWVLGAANVIQTIPSLALFGFLIPLPLLGGIGARTAVVALILYALLPIIRNTHAGIASVDPAIREAGVGMGMTDWQLLTRVDLPLALGIIMTGLRLATVISVGVATIAAAIGAGGLGMYIFRGVSMVDDQLILAGALPAALLALAADFLLGLLGRAVTRKPLLCMKLLAAGALAALAAGGAFLLASGGEAREARPIVIGSKNFTEQSILGELLAQRLERAGFKVDRRLYLGGTLICHNALVAGQIDAYVEYTGTAYTAILKRTPVSDARRVYDDLQKSYLEGFGVRLTRPLGFNNTFAIMVRGGDARRLGVKTISDAVAHARRWRAAFGVEFLEREDGYRGLAAAYGLDFAEPPKVMDLGLTYRALADGKVDLIAGDATNGLVSALDLFILEDDLGYFPPYEAVPFVRADALAGHAGLQEAIDSLGGVVSDETMQRLNYAVDGERRDLREVVGEFLDGLGR